MAQYELQDDGSVTVHNIGHRFIQGWSDVRANAVLADTGDASLVVDFTGKGADPSGTPNYTVLDTDYETYSIIYACGGLLGLASWDFLWIMSRTPTLDDATLLTLIDKIEERLPNYGFFDNHQMTR